MVVEAVAEVGVMAVIRVGVIIPISAIPNPRTAKVQDMIIATLHVIQNLRPLFTYQAEDNPVLDPILVIILLGKEVR